MQLITGMKKIYEGVSETLEGVNPLVTTMETNQNVNIAITLMDAGYSVSEIQDFIDVSRVQFDEWAQFEVEVRKRMSNTDKTPSLAEQTA